MKIRIIDTMSDIVNLIPVVISGGSGSRLWPLSRKDRPKQFLNLISSKSMLQETVLRFTNTTPAGISFDDPLIVCSQDHRFYAKENLEELGVDGNIILEKDQKNTAPAIALAANNLNYDDLMLVLPADHLIDDIKDFLTTIDKAILSAIDNKIVTFGVKPTSPKTGYGYIKTSKQEDRGSSSILEFIEKPEQDKANELVKSDEYLWNSGIFLFKAGEYLSALEKFQPNVFKCVEGAMKNKAIDGNFILPDYNFMSECPSISIDYGVMEKISNGRVVKFNSGWSDIGSWESLSESKSKDSNNNSFEGDVIIHNSKNIHVHSEDHLVVVSNVEDIVIVNTRDALFVSKKSSLNESKSIIESLRNEPDRLEFFENREIHRPWGKYDSIDNGNGFQVKRITVKPKQKLSVQMHYHRSEHWVVVSGIGRVHYGKEYRDLHINDSTYHDKEVVHALENPGEEPLILIEIQVGEYLGEDDIVRFEDIYGRIDK